MQAILDYLSQVDLRKFAGGSFFLLALGIFIILVGSSEDEHRQQHLDLLSGGTKAVAQVTRQSHWSGKGGDHYDLDYQYTVGDQTYSAETDVDVGREVYEKSPVGNPLKIVYLPGDPSVSSANPQGWLHKQVISNVYGWCFAIVGAVGLVVAACLGLAAGRQPPSF